MWLFMRGGLVLLLWIAWLVYWRVSAADVKPAVRHESKWLRASYVIPILIASILISIRPIAGGVNSLSLLRCSTQGSSAFRPSGFRVSCSEFRATALVERKRFEGSRRCERHSLMTDSVILSGWDPRICLPGVRPPGRAHPWLSFVVASRQHGQLRLTSSRMFPGNRVGPSALGAATSAHPWLRFVVASRQGSPDQRIS